MDKIKEAIKKFNKESFLPVGENFRLKEANCTVVYVNVGQGFMTCKIDGDLYEEVEYIISHVNTTKGRFSISRYLAPTGPTAEEMKECRCDSTEWEPDQQCTVHGELPEE